MLKVIYGNSYAPKADLEDFVEGLIVLTKVLFKGIVFFVTMIGMGFYIAYRGIRWVVLKFPNR